MATSLKFYLKKDYNQLRNRIIAQNTITFTFCDYTPAKNEIVFFAIKEQNDVDEDETYLRMRKKDDNEFSIDLPCNKNEVFEFRIFTKFENSDEIIEQSAINTFKFEGIIFDEEKYRLTHIKNEIASTKAILSKTDYQIIKSMEYFLSKVELPGGLELPYDIKTIHESRETFRDKINKLEEEELNYILESETN